MFFGSSVRVAKVSKITVEVNRVWKTVSPSGVLVEDGRLQLAQKWIFYVPQGHAGALLANICSLLELRTPAASRHRHLGVGVMQSVNRFGRLLLRYAVGLTARKHN